MGEPPGQGRIFTDPESRVLTATTSLSCSCWFAKISTGWAGSDLYVMSAVGVLGDFCDVGSAHALPTGVGGDAPWAKSRYHPTSGCG